jgi:hypothetical protein
MDFWNNDIVFVTHIKFTSWVKRHDNIVKIEIKKYAHIKWGV